MFKTLSHVCGWVHMTAATTVSLSLNDSGTERSLDETLGGGSETTV